MSELVVMPKADWKAALDATRAKTGKTDLIKSGDLAGEIESISAGGGGEEEVNLAKALITRTITEISDDTIETIGTSAFYDCKKLTKINFSNANNSGRYAFQNCIALKEINLPKFTSTGEYMFSHCSSLESVTLPRLVDMASDTFAYCSSLTTVDIPMVGVVCGFYNCPKLTTVRCPSAYNLYNQCFYGCTSLTEFDSSTVTRLSNSAFNGCSKLTLLVLRNTETVCYLYSTNVFKNTPFDTGKAGGKLLIPRTLVDGYKNGTNWSVILTQNTNNKFLALEDYTVDGTITGAIDWDKLNAA